MLKLNQQTVKNWIDQAYLPALRVGRRARVRRTDLDELLEKSPAGPSRRVAVSAAQAFWDGDIPAPLVEPDEPE